MSDDEKKDAQESQKDTASVEHKEDPSMTMALFVYWILPALLFAIFCRYTVDTTIPTFETKVLPPKRPQQQQQQQLKQQTQPTPSTRHPPTSSNWPTYYRDTVTEIEKRRPLWKNRPKGNAKKEERQPPARPRGKKSDPQRTAFIEQIDELREYVQSHPSDLHGTINFADALRMYDLNFREGGIYEAEAIQVYQRAIQMALQKRDDVAARGDPTNQSAKVTSVNEEVSLGYSDKSPDGLVCAIRCALGKVYFMANMFDRAVGEYTACLDIAPYYLDALHSRGSALIILGRLEEAGKDLLDVALRDEQRIFNDVFSGLARILEADEGAIYGGWKTMVDLLQRLIPLFEEKFDSSADESQRYGASSLNNFHHALFSYYDKKVKDYDQAWYHLTKAYEYKMSMLNPWVKGSELGKIENTKKVFVPGFWMTGTGSSTKTPIFIVGFVRSGSTLLERVLDSHPLIVGTGENSVFNGRLDEIRNEIVDASNSGRADAIPNLTKRLADNVVDGYRERWMHLEANNPSATGNADPQRFVDKMLTNYNNVGFIHLLYPKALILHVHRNPMDSIFSAYKHEFPGGTLDYTSDFDALAEIYHAYRDMIDHWDNVLPGRVTHVSYEEMVHDMPGMARAIIEAVGLPWDDGVLDFHKKKHAVNTLSTTQVRKGVYKDSLRAWAKYETQLQPMVQKLGDRIEFKNLRDLQPIQITDEL